MTSSDRFPVPVRSAVKSKTSLIGAAKTYLSVLKAQNGLGSNRSHELSGSVLGKLFTPIMPLVAALSRVAGVTAGLLESNGSLPPTL